MLKTLVVDDSLNFRTALQEALQSRLPFCQIIGAASVRRALDEVAAVRPDLLITDLMLPDGSGLDLVRRLRAMRFTAPIVMVTIHDLPEYREAAASSGADKFFAKLTMSLHDLVEYVDSLVAGRLRVLSVCRAPALGRAMEALMASRWPDALCVHATDFDEGARIAGALKPHVAVSHAGDEAHQEQVYCRTLRAACAGWKVHVVCLRHEGDALAVPAGADFVVRAGVSLGDELALVLDLARAERLPRPLVA